jgi:hypothetical protein
MVKTPAGVEYTRREILDRLEQGAQTRRGISAAKLLRAYRDGTLEEPGEVADLLALSDLLADNDPIFDAA